MAWTKRQIISAAFDELGLGSYVYSLSVEQYVAALLKLDAMMNEWASYGVSLGYSSSDSPSNTDLDDDSQIPSYAVSGVYLNLALRIAPSYGKTVSKETSIAAKNGYSAICNQSVQVVKRKRADYMPIGSGNQKLVGPLYNYPPNC